jgi:ATP-dependent Clp protease ATP-binding subunit ClpB
MQQQIDDQLANLILAGQIHDGSLVKVDLTPGAENLTVSVSSLD